MSIENTINSLNDKCETINKKLDEYIRWEEVPMATTEQAGWMSVQDKAKLDNIINIDQSELENALTL